VAAVVVNLVPGEWELERSMEQWKSLILWGGSWESESGIELLWGYVSLTMFAFERAVEVGFRDIAD
jgi:hypothetical protein